MEQSKHINAFPKKEHLCGEVKIEELFKVGKKFLVHPVKVVYSILPYDEKEENVRVMFSVPKRNFKHAVKRNRVKRLMREAYRLQKHIITDIAKEKNISIHVALCFISSELPTYKTMYKKTTRIVHTLVERVANI